MLIRFMGVLSEVGGWLSGLLPLRLYRWERRGNDNDICKLLYPVPYPRASW